ncbi:MAG: sel1 repeat family protein [Verrucomicrobiales bacterium]|nr:sel1 repeat family protein [Verrucomicrobiales bacterium]
MSHEKLPLILHPGSDLALLKPHAARIVTEMVSGTLATAKRRELSVSNEELTAEEWFQKGESHYYGWKTDRDYEEAAKCYQTAAETGHLDAVCNLACLRTVGLGVMKDVVKAIRLFEYAAGRGHAVALFNLSYFCEAELDVGVDRRDASLYDELGRIRNEPQKRWWYHPLLKMPPSVVLETLRNKHPGVLMTDGVIRYDHSFRFDPCRTANFVTFYEVMLPGLEDLSHLGENDAGNVLRKVRLVAIPCSEVSGCVLVVDSGDSFQTCGDLLEPQFFEASAHFLMNQGGKPAEGIVCNPQQGEMLCSEAFGQFIVGTLRDGRIELGAKAHSQLASRKIIASFYQRGLGVQQDGAEAQRWQNL